MFVKKNCSTRRRNNGNGWLYKEWIKEEQGVWRILCKELKSWNNEWGFILTKHADKTLLVDTKFIYVIFMSRAVAVQGFKRPKANKKHEVFFKLIK